MSPLDAFLRLYRDDEKNGRVRSLREYMDLFPGNDAAIAREYLLNEDERASTDADIGPRDAVEAQFLEAYGKDRQAGEVRPLAAYESLFPGYEDRIHRHYHQLEGSALAASGSLGAEKQQLGPYEIGEEIGRGGQGIVHKATDTRIGRTVAVKILHGLGPGAAATLTRFKREAQAAAKTNHHGVCAVYDAQMDGGLPYIAMRYVEGETLARQIATCREAVLAGDSSASVHDDAILFEDEPTTSEDPVWAAHGERQRADVTAAMLLIEKAARALHVVHEAGVVHRDMKPGNLMITPEGEPVVMDFGLAHDSDSDLQTLTRSGDLFGTPAYMSPEQLTRHGIRLDRRTDVWSLAVMLYECVTLQRPFEGPRREALYQQILTTEQVDPRTHNPDTPRDLATVIATALEKDRDRRYQTALEFAEELRRVREYEPILARPVSSWTRVMRWTQRNPALALTTAATALLLIAGTTVSTVFAFLVQEKAREAQANLEDWERLADGQTLKGLIAEANEDLWPAFPDKLAGIEEWLLEARSLGRRLEEHRLALLALQGRASKWTEGQQRRDRDKHTRELDRLAEMEAEATHLLESRQTCDAKLRSAEAGLASLRAKARPTRRDELRIEQFEEQREAAKEELATLGEHLASLDEERASLTRRLGERLTWTFKDPRDQTRHDGLRDLVHGLEALTGPGQAGVVTIASLAARRKFAATIASRSFDDHEAAWQATIKRIAGSARYGGLSFRRQLGLVPLGPDPDSGLEEFAHLQTGDLPSRDPDSGKLLLADGTALVFVLIPGGAFTMGAQPNDLTGPNHDPQAGDDEGPPHPVRLSPFLLSKYEMTQGQWMTITALNPSHYLPGEEQVTVRNPVEQVSWTDCDVVLRRLALTLPTEAQWEYACRATTSTAFWTGDNKQSLSGAATLADRAAARSGATWQIEDSPELDDGFPVHGPVGSRRPNPFGLHDMHGNVGEWCADWYWYTMYEKPARAGDGLRGVIRAASRVIRGGHFGATAAAARSANRNRLQPSVRVEFVGVRPAAPIAEK